MSRTRLIFPVLVAFVVLSPCRPGVASDGESFGEDAGDDDGPDEVYTDPVDDDSAAPLYDGQFSGGGVSCSHARRGAGAIAGGLVLVGFGLRRRLSTRR